MNADLDYNIMKKAVNEAYKRNDSLRIRITEVDKEIKQYFAEHEDPVFGYLNF